MAVLGIGGLGHLGVHYSVKLGFETVAIARGRDKEELARRLGAQHYIDSTAGDPGAALSSLGGADVIMSTATSADAMAQRNHGVEPGPGSNAPSENPSAPQFDLREKLAGHTKI
ncbi:MAG: zinc-binding dehydrogenase [Pseudonocardiaceae bacterium]